MAVDFAPSVCFLERNLVLRVFSANVAEVLIFGYLFSMRFSCRMRWDIFRWHVNLQFDVTLVVVWRHFVKVIPSILHLHVFQYCFSW